jgi:hypothetical protein
MTGSRSYLLNGTAESKKQRSLQGGIKVTLVR